MEATQDQPDRVPLAAPGPGRQRRRQDPCENLGVGYPDKDREDVFWHRTVSRRLTEWNSGRNKLESQLLTELILQLATDSWPQKADLNYREACGSLS
jgi:hypothetical protein